MASGDRAYGGGATADRSIAQWFCIVVGATLVVVGLVGFIADSSFDTGSGVSGSDLIVFEVNGWHNLVHIASGAFLLAMAGRHSTARTAAFAFGGIYAIVTVWALIDGNDVLGLIPVDAADNVLHILLTLAALAAGFLSTPDRDPALRPAPR